MPVKKLEEDSISNSSEVIATPTGAENNINNGGDNNSKATTGMKPPVIKRKTTTGGKKLANDDPLRFEGNGLDFKAKLIGIQDVVEARGDQMCQEAMMAAKAIVKNSGQHKHRITVNVSIEGIKIKDEKNGHLMHSFPVHKISFIARDTSDTRAFGFVYGTPENNHKFYGIKTEQKSDTVVLAIRDMFHVVYEMKKRQIEDAKKNSQDSEANGEKKIDQNANDTTKGPAVDNLLDLEVVFEGMKENLGQMSSWEAFESSSNSESGSGGLAKGSSFSSTVPTSDFSQSGNWSVNSLLNDSSSDPFADVINKSSSPKPGIQQTTPMSLQNDLQQLYSLQQGTPVADPFAALHQAQMPFESAGLFNLPTPLAQQQITAQVFVSPAATLGHTMGINSTGGDPFDTSHVSQMLKQTSTPQHSSGMLSGFGLGGVNVSQQPSAIRADSTGNDSFFGSASVFDSRSTVGMTSNVSPGQLGSGTDSSLNHAWSESKFQSELFGAMASSPMILTPLKPTGTSSPSPQPTQPQYQKPPASVEEGLGVLCDIHNLDLSTRPSAGPAAKVDPFSSLKNPPKPTINELLKGGQTIDVNPPRMFDLGFPQLSNMPPPMHQSASTPVFTVGSPPISNPFAQQPNGISTPVTSQGVNSWNSTVNNGWMATTTIQQPIGYQMSMGFNGDLAAPPVAPRSSGRSAALPPPIQATNFLSGSAQKSQISCGNGSQASNPFADDFFK